MKKIFFIMIISLSFLSEVLYANYATIAQVTFHVKGKEFKFPESVCVDIGEKIAKDIGMFVNKTSIGGRGTTLFIQKRMKGSSFMQVQCVTKGKSKKAHAVYIVVSNSNKAARNNLSKKYSDKFASLISKKYSVYYGISGPSTL